MKVLMKPYFKQVAGCAVAELYIKIFNLMGLQYMRTVLSE